MKRRDFVFGSLEAAALLSPVLSLREARAQSAPPKRVFFWLANDGYPEGEDFFPTGTATAFTLGPIMSAFQDLKSDLVIIDGIDSRRTGFDTGSNHVRTVGKALTAKDLLPDPSDPEDADPGGASVDQIIARELGLASLEVLVHDRLRYVMREMPFATGPRQFKPPFCEPDDAWVHAFDGAPAGAPDAERERLRRLRRRHSLLDDLTADLARFRTRLDGLERLKLDIHEDAIRRAELSVQADLAATRAPACTIPGAPPGTASMPARAAAHFDTLFAAFACNRIQLGAMAWGGSGYHWRYEWLVPGLGVNTSIHDEVHHHADTRRDDFVAASTWDWAQLAAFARRLKATPEGTGTMLDHTLVVAMSSMGLHHYSDRLPVVLLGARTAGLEPGRYLALPSPRYNDQLLTSVARLMGVNLAGLGDDPSCGPLPQL